MPTETSIGKHVAFWGALIGIPGSFATMFGTWIAYQTWVQAPPPKSNTQDVAALQPAPNDRRNGQTASGSGSRAPCVIPQTYSFHLRPRPVESRSGSIQYPAGVSVEVLEPTNVYREGDQRLFLVRVTSDQNRGYVFLTPGERAMCNL